jgi:Zn finger protein HypA/HybF involved in hydrogenase expression
MHELSMISALCRKVEEIALEHEASKVVRIVLETNDPEHMMEPEHLRDVFVIFRESSPLLKDTVIEFRKSDQIAPHEIILRDVELERS